MNEPTPSTAQENRPSILHICRREMLRPLRDEILRLSGYHVESTINPAGARSMLSSRPYDLVLIDVEGERGVREAEQLCSEIKTAAQQQVVAFVCNWRVANMTDCPDDVIRTEFDPVAFVNGVRGLLPVSSN